VAAIAIMAFVCVHLYLLTTGDHGFSDHVKPRVSGFDDVDLTDEEYAYLRTGEPGKLKD
jgi:hypothetical protein